MHRVIGFAVFLATFVGLATEQPLFHCSLPSPEHCTCSHAHTVMTRSGGDGHHGLLKFSWDCSILCMRCPEHRKINGCRERSIL